MLLTDIARKACVSPATVSRAINQPQLVAADSLARIRDVMQQHNYVPSPVNRRRGPKVRSAEQHRIGVWFVGARPNNPNLHWFQDQLMQIPSADTRYRVDLRVLHSSSPDHLPRNIAQEQLAGVIVQGMEPSAAALAQLREVPSVWFMTRRSTSYAGDYVEPNNEENGRMAADYLKSKGHKSVAVISSDPDYSAIVHRNHAFVERARELGLRSTPFSANRIPASATSRLPRPTAKARIWCVACWRASPPRRDFICPWITFAARFSARCARRAKSPARISRLFSATTIR